jgi:hypothetical protein
MADQKQTRQILILTGLMVVAILVWYFQFAKRPVAAGFSLDSKTYTPINAQDFGGVLDKLDKAQSTEYKSTGRNIFVMGAVPAPAADDGPKAIQKPAYLNRGPQLPPPPPKPVLGWKFFGYGNLPSGGPRQAFLLDGEDVRIVSEGETVQNSIRILRIGNETIEYEDVNTHQRNSNPIEAAPTTPAA